MKVAITYDEGHILKPLDEAEILGVLDDNSKEIIQYKNPGYQISKELSMQAILGLKVDAIVVKEKFLCPGSYNMSHGKLKYVVPRSYKVEDVLETISSERPIEVLEEDMYSEPFEER